MGSELSALSSRFWVHGFAFGKGGREGAFRLWDSRQELLKSLSYRCSMPQHDYIGDYSGGYQVEY